MPDAAYLLPHEAAAHLRVAVKTLTKWRWLGKGPPYRKVAGNRIRYVQGELDEWMAQQVVVPAHALDTDPLPPTPRAALHALPPRRRRASRAQH
jgi:predicted DNA-binding transcriptional regulator AlpA